ncbi:MULTISPECIES: hypothetical protein [Oceanobacillus]|uniref:PTS system, cellobiose-specific IIB component n=1 Tax=Oceanobacillus aidingensis TaxID=645964 RepID=A0ABV9K1R8_9BACI
MLLVCNAGMSTSVFVEAMKKSISKYIMPPSKSWYGNCHIKLSILY